MIAYLEEALLSFKDKRLENEIFQNLDLRHVDFRWIEGFKLHFENCQLTGALIGGAEFIHCSFANCLLDHIEWVGSSLRYTNFENCKMRNNIFHVVDLNAASFTNCNLKDSVCDSCEMKPTTFKACSLIGCIYNARTENYIYITQSQVSPGAFEKATAKDGNV